jgi:hypothetical protein
MPLLTFNELHAMEVLLASTPRLAQRRARSAKRAVATVTAQRQPTAPTTANIRPFTIVATNKTFHLRSLATTLFLAATDPAVFPPRPCPRAGSSTPRTRPSSAYVSCPLDAAWDPADPPQ